MPHLSLVVFIFVVEESVETGAALATGGASAGVKRRSMRLDRCVGRIVGRVHSLEARFDVAAFRGIAVGDGSM